MKNIIIFGCERRLNSCVEILGSEKKFPILNLICKTKKNKYSKYKILDDDKKLKLIKKKYKNALIRVRQIKNHKQETNII